MQNTTSRQALPGSQLDAATTALFSAPKIVAGTTYTLTGADIYRTLLFTSGSSITVTIPLSLGPAFNCRLIRNGAGSVSLSAASGVTLNNKSSHTALGNQYSVANLYATSGNVLVLYGDTA